MDSIIVNRVHLAPLVSVIERIPDGSGDLALMKEDCNSKKDEGKKTYLFLLKSVFGTLATMLNRMFC